VPLAKLTVNLSEFAGLGGAAQTKYHTLKPKKGMTGGPFVVVVTYHAENAGDAADGESETDQVEDGDFEGKDEPDPFKDEHHHEKKDSVDSSASATPPSSAAIG
jgi:hypothetical protein